MSTEPAAPDWLANSPWAKMWPEGVDRIILDETDSTMTRAAAIAPPERPTWIMARHQTGARGRRGRVWQHPQGNFAATLVFRPQMPPRQAALASFVAALALGSSLAAWADDSDIAFKWPNDVLLRGCKVAGILLEASGQGDRVDWLSVGFGINLVTVPEPGTLEDGAVEPIALAHAAPWPRFEDEPHESEVFLAHLALDFQTHWDILQQTDFSTIRTLWLSKAARIGQQITVRTGHETLIGTFDTVDDDGQLVLSTPDGVRRIAAADVYFD